MSQAFVNKAAWVVAEKAHPMQVRDGPTPNPTENEVLIKVAYAAVNPTDYIMQSNPYFQMEYPFIFGTDVAGTVVQVGSQVKQFQIGQRVIGHCDSLFTRKATNAGFQHYSACRQGLVSAIPDLVPLANAAVLPLAVDTAAGALFQKLALPLPSLDPKPIGKTILIWGASSSVGSCAVQLAVAAGLRVIATAGASNLTYVKELGASEVFDHRAESTLGQIKAILKPGDVVMDAISTGETQQTCAIIVDHIGGGDLAIMRWPEAKFAAGVKVHFVNGLATGFTSEELGEWGPGATEIGKAIWHDYMPKALASGKFVPKPDPRVLKGGLDRVQEGVDLVKAGVSATKIVIEVSEQA
ncbi:hypothetical protein ANO11243_009650 [Dothideomycetidae sp. 11243]|nr:hypothetical protein ANO11243_009650 [fungal sp. No.11243]